MLVLALLLGALLITLALCASGPDFRRGDFNVDGTINITDPSGGAGFLFSGGPASSCADANDDNVANDDGVISITDAVGLPGHLFSGELTLSRIDMAIAGSLDHAQLILRP